MRVRTVGFRRRGRCVLIYLRVLDIFPRVRPILRLRLRRLCGLAWFHVRPSRIQSWTSWLVVGLDRFLIWSSPTNASFFFCSSIFVCMHSRMYWLQFNSILFMSFFMSFGIFTEITSISFWPKSFTQGIYL
jgi:hypothetical protein